jgi:hypothetical protein
MAGAILFDRINGSDRIYRISRILDLPIRKNQYPTVFSVSRANEESGREAYEA